MDGHSNLKTIASGSGPSMADVGLHVIDDELITIIEKYSYLLGQLQFEKAREYVEEQRLQLTKSMNVLPKDLQTMLAILAQVC